jgi:hypothetical protein
MTGTNGPDVTRIPAGHIWSQKRNPTSVIFASARGNRNAMPNHVTPPRAVHIFDTALP